MGERPTPEEIASTYKGGVKVLRRLESYGYRIVHPDDVPDVWKARSDGWWDGFNELHDHIFGEGS